MKKENKKQEVRLHRFRNIGVHTYDTYIRKNIIDSSCIEEIPEIEPNYDCECNYKINTFFRGNKEWINNKDVQKNICQIFIYGEYIKRKFYLDCLKDDSGIQNKKHNFYEQKKFKSYEEIKNNTSDIFVAPDRREMFSLNLDNIKYERFMPLLNNFNRYIYIKRLFYFFINRIKYILVNPRKFNELSKEDIEFIERAFSEKHCSIYLCERLLYIFSNPNIIELANITFDYHKNKNNKSMSFLFYRLQGILLSKFWDLFPQAFLILYRSIVDKYSLYMYELFNLSDMNYIIKNNFKIDKLPRFFFLPQEPVEDSYASKNVDIQFILSKRKILINIDLDDKIDSLGVSKYVRDTIMSIIYQHKQNLELGYSKNELLYFNKFIDFNNKHNKTETFEERIYGLYMWDKLNRPFSINTISWAIKHMQKKFPIISRRSTGATEKRFLRIYNSTRKSIERLEYLPLK